MKENPRKKGGWRYWRSVGGFALAAACIGLLLFLHVSHPSYLSHGWAHPRRQAVCCTTSASDGLNYTETSFPTVDELTLTPSLRITPTPSTTPWIRITATVTRTPMVEGTPAPYCRPGEASISLSPSATELEVGQAMTTTLRLANGETSEAKLGRILYRLRIEPNILAIESDEAVEHTLTLEPGDWDQAKFVLRAVEPGQVTLSGWASYETHALDYSWGSNSGCYSRALEIAITP